MYLCCCSVSNMRSLKEARNRIWRHQLWYQSAVKNLWHRVQEVYIHSIFLLAGSYECNAQPGGCPAGGPVDDTHVDYIKDPLVCKIVCKMRWLASVERQFSTYCFPSIGAKCSKDLIYLIIIIPRNFVKKVGWLYLYYSSICEIIQRFIANQF